MSADTLPPVGIEPELSRQLATAGRKSKEWTRQRDQLIVRALAAGAGPREVARLCGLTHPTVIAIQRRELARQEEVGGG